MKTCPCKEQPPYTPLLYSKTGVYPGIHFFLIFALKHRSWVLVRTASARRFYKRVPTIYILSKNKKKITFFHLNITFFTTVKYCSILHGHVCVMYTSLCVDCPVKFNKVTVLFSGCKGHWLGFNIRNRCMTNFHSNQYRHCSYRNLLLIFNF